MEKGDGSTDDDGKGLAHTHTAHQQEFDIIYMQLCIQQEERERLDCMEETRRYLSVYVWYNRESVYQIRPFISRVDGSDRRPVPHLVEIRCAR